MINKHGSGIGNVDSGIGLAIALVVVAVKTVVPNAEEKS